MTNKTYIKNTALLFSAMAVTKIVGAVFKIPLANILGGTGMAYFSTAYNLYSPVFALTAAGVPTVIMRLTAKNIALGRNQNAERLKKTAMMLFTLVGACGMLLIWLFSSFFANNIACSPQSLTAIITIAPAVLFCCIGAVIRGYYEGRSDVVPSATANITEAVSRAIIGLALSYGVVAYAKHCFDNGIAFCGKYYNTYEEMYSAALPSAAAAAIFAVTLSELAGLIALIVTDRRKHRRIHIHTDSIPADRRKKIASDIIRELVPIAAFALVMNCFSFVDLMTVTRTLDTTIKSTPDFFMRTYPSALSSGIAKEELANFMYGSYTGIAMSLFMLIPSFSGMTEKTSIPGIAAAWEKKDHNSLKEKISELIKATAAIGFPACFGALALSGPILNVLYPDKSAEISVCVDAFSVLCTGGIFMILASTIFGIFQAIGKGHIPLIIMAGVIVIKAVLNTLLLKIPELNITGAAVSTVLSYFAAMLIGAIILKRTIRGVRLLRPMAPTAFSAVLCALTASLVFSHVQEAAGVATALLSAVFAGGFVYILLLILVMLFRQLL